jgi:hypothetical protein
MALTDALSMAGVGAEWEAPYRWPVTIALVENSASPAVVGVNEKPVRAVAAIGLVPTLPHTLEPGVVDTPDLLKMAKSPAAPRSTGSIVVIDKVRSEEEAAPPAATGFLLRVLPRKLPGSSWVAEACVGTLSKATMTDNNT